MNKTIIKRISAILCVLLLIIILSGCSINCVHCHNKYKNYGSFPYAVLDFNDWSRDALYFQRDRKPINYDLCQNYSSLKKYIEKYTVRNVEEFFCLSTFSNNYVLVLWKKIDDCTERVFTNIVVDENTITMYYNYISEKIYTSRQSIYLIAIPQTSIPSDFDSTIQYEVKLIESE